MNKKRLVWVFAPFLGFFTTAALGIAPLVWIGIMVGGSIIGTAIQQATGVILPMTCDEIKARDLGAAAVEINGIGQKTDQEIDNLANDRKHEKDVRGQIDSQISTQCIAAIGGPCLKALDEIETLRNQYEQALTTAKGNIGCARNQNELLKVVTRDNSCILNSTRIEQQAGLVNMCINSCKMNLQSAETIANRIKNLRPNVEKICNAFIAAAQAQPICQREIPQSPVKGSVNASSISPSIAPVQGDIKSSSSSDIRDIRRVVKPTINRTTKLPD